MVRVPVVEKFIIVTTMIVQNIIFKLCKFGRVKRKIFIAAIRVSKRGMVRVTVVERFIILTKMIVKNSI